MSNNVLNSGQELKPGEALTSPNGYYSLRMQQDGNLVLYHHDHPRWASQTDNQPVTICIMQTDGNLVLYTDHSPVFATHTEGHDGAGLILQDDGNAVIYQGLIPIWASNTVDPRGGSLFPFDMVNTNPVKGRATAHVSKHGIATLSIKGTHSGVSGSSRYKAKIALADQDGNSVWFSPWATLTIGADSWKGTNTKESSWEYPVPSQALELAKKAGLLFDREHSDWAEGALDDTLVELITRGDQVWKRVKNSELLKDIMVWIVAA